MTLLETLIVLTFFGFVGSLVTLAVSANARAKVKAALGFAAPAAPAPRAAPAPPGAPAKAAGASSDRATSERRAEALRSGALRWLEGRAESACPTIDDLGQSQGAVDAWGYPFELSCQGEEVYARSAGPDGVRASGDDVVVPAGDVIAPAGDVAAPTGDVVVPSVTAPQLPRRPTVILAPWAPGEAAPQPDVIIGPKRISGDDPVYTAEARRAGVSGKFIAKCVITAEGALRDCRVVKALPSLDGAVLKALASYRYEPTRINDRPTDVEYTFTFNFPPP